jgi:NitT/TauT family transport system ATP-binding protein
MVELKLKNVEKKYIIGKRSVEVIDNVSFSVRRREAISIVGPSGCGKTTLIRMIAGLEQPTKGGITHKGKPITAPTEKISMIFESFALLPWKTVLENVELALLDKPKKERVELAKRHIDLVGLDGFEESYPRELSAGMKQRVDIARAVSREPDILLMDEPFDKLDPLTAMNLKNEILRLFNARKLKPNIIIMITHNIEEAVYMSNRIIVLSKRPTRVVESIEIDLPRPPDVRSEKFLGYVDRITSLIT